METLGEKPSGQVKRPKIDQPYIEMQDQSPECDAVEGTETEDQDSGIDRTNDFPNTPLVLHCQGAEARLYRTVYLGKSVIVKERFPKSYRQPQLDDHLRRERSKSEVRCMARCRSAGIVVPPLYFVDPIKNRLVFGFIDDAITVREYICNVYAEHQTEAARNQSLIPLADEIGGKLAMLHSNDVIHGDLTTSNMLIRTSTDQACQLILIDFGLSYIARLPEDKGVDLYVLEKAFLSTHPNTEHIFERILTSYSKQYTIGGGGRKALDKLAEVRLRGRKREMIG